MEYYITRGGQDIALYITRRPRYRILKQEEVKIQHSIT